MDRRRHINLEDIPWPISILKFNQAVSEMKPGDQIVAFLKDTDVMTNLLQLLHHRADMGVTTRASGCDLCIEVKKEKCVSRRQGIDNPK